MESEDNNATPSPSAAEARRRSGRVVRAPQKYIEEVHTDASSKRKRARDHDEDAENHEPRSDSLAEASDEEVAEESDADLVPRQKKSKSRAKKPAAKKPKINGDAPTEVAPAQTKALQLPQRLKKSVRVAIARKDGDGLYGEQLNLPIRAPSLEFVLKPQQPRFSAPATLPAQWPPIGSSVT